MREIKFRAWSENAKQMIYSNKEVTVWAGGTEPSVNTDDGKIIGDFKIMQFTGLKDKNGNEIYEGDICMAYQKLYEIPSPLICKIVYNEDNARFEPQQFWKGDNKWKCFYEQFERYDFGIIGNIYENPELINKTK